MAQRPHLFSVAAARALIARPALWPTALRVGWRLLDPSWWRRVPPLPRPAAAYQQFRHQTMYGSDPDARLGPDDLVGYLEWCARMRRLAR